MKFLVFAGGSGKRFWPLGRESLPKQFLQIFDGKSTLELTIDRLLQLTDIKNIFVSTHKNYVEGVKKLIPNLPEENIIAEPYRRDVGPAVGLSLVRLRKLGLQKEPVMLVWADHYIRDVENFVKNIKKAFDIVKENKVKGVLIGETPGFASTNLGWIKIGSNITETEYEFDGFAYRPPQEEVDHLFENKKGLWNTAYFISTPEYMLSLYEKHVPQMYKGLEEIEKALFTESEEKIVDNIFKNLEEKHFDHIVFYNVVPSDIRVIKTNMGWTDPGTLYALKKFYRSDEQNHSEGLSYFSECSDSMVINKDSDKLVVGVGLDNVMIVNTKDAILVIKGTKAKKLSDVVKELRDDPRYSKFFK